MSYLPNMSFFGQLNSNEEFISPYRKIPDGYNSLIVSIKKSEQSGLNGTLQF